MKILLMGNPNVGKSALFSRLTGTRIIASNYPGTTVEFTEGHIKLHEEIAQLIDVPGVYSLEPTCKAEEVAVDMVKEGDLIINVVDATNLERNLNLTLELLEIGKPIIVALNMWDDTHHRGIDIDVTKLENILSVPVVPTVGVTGQGIKDLVERIPQAVIPKKEHIPGAVRWSEVGEIVGQVQSLSHRHHTWRETLEDISNHPAGGAVFAILVLFVSFWVIRLIGEGIIGYVMDPFFEGIWSPLLINARLTR